MRELNFETGLVEFDINGKITVSFNPTDSNFIERLYATFEELDRKQEQYKSDIEKMADKRKVFDYAKERDTEMRGMIDDVFGAPVSDALFGDMNVYAVAGGLPVWCNLMLAVMNEVDSTFAREQKATNPRIAKYTAKYKKK